jgi:hypothetical protein
MLRNVNAMTYWRRLSQCLKKNAVLARQLEYWRVYIRGSTWKRLFACLSTRMRSKLSMNVCIIKGNQSIDKFLMSLKGSSRKDSVLIAFRRSKIIEYHPWNFELSHFSCVQTMCSDASRFPLCQTVFFTGMFEGSGRASFRAYP